jgi:hypothetical protein
MSAMIHWFTGDCIECDRPVAFLGTFGYPQGMWLHTGGPWSGEEADIRLGHIAKPKGTTCSCCGGLVETVAV